MKKRLSIILLLFTIFLSSISYVDEVWGAEYKADVSGTSSGPTTPCTGGNCYSLGTGGIRFTLVDGNGKRVAETKTVDFWYFANKNHVGLRYFFYENETKVVYFKKTEQYDKTRQTLYAFDYFNLSNKFGDIHISVGDDEYNINSIEDVFPNILEGLNNYHTKSEDLEGFSCQCKKGETECYCDSHKKLNTRIPNVTETIMKRITEKATDDNTYMDKLYKAMNAEGKVEDTHYLQVEPLVQFGNFQLQGDTSMIDINANTAKSYVFYGTTSELTLLFSIVSNNSSMAKNIFCVKPTGSGYCGTGGARSAFNQVIGYHSDNNGSDYYKYGSYGIYTKKEEGGPLTTPGGIFTRIDRDNLQLGLAAYRAVSADTYNKMAYGVGFISLKDIADKSCHEQAYNLLTTKYKNKFDKKNGYYLGKGEEINAGGDLCSIKEIADECCTSGKLNGKCQQLSPEYLGNVGILVDKNISENNNLCKKADCDTIVGKINSFYSKEEATKSDKYYSIINHLFVNSATIFNSEQRGLNPIIWQFYGDKATCKRTIPPCASPSVAKCTSGAGEKEIIFKDSNDTVNCIQQGIAYNNLFNASDGVPSVIKSSKDKYYSSKGFGDVYCTEEVKFIIPNGGQTAVAGTVFKWGINIDKSDNVFGTMKVTRTCYLSDKFRDGTTKTFDSYWVWDDDGKKEIDPTISIKYKQAKNHDLDVFDVNTSLGIRLREYDSYTNPDGLGDKNRIIYKKDGTLDTTEIKKIYPDIIVDKITDKKYIHDTGAGEKDNNPRTITCKTNDDGENTCANIQYITTTATYDIFYKDDLKWFSDKSLNGELITIGAEGLQPSYTFAGYGLPTSFPNPHNEICSQWNDTTLPDDFNKANGELNLYVYNVGTGGHFNDLIGSKDLFEDDDDANNNEINYYCDYKIKNKLFDNEYALKEEYMCDPNRTPKGIDVVFRTIDLISSKDELNKAFPGRSGSGREMGANWYKFSDESIADLLGDNVYNQEPMYEITLDSPTIQTIREWNNNARAKDIDPYTDMEESKASDASDDSYGFTGYEYYTITKNFDGEDHEYSFVASKFLEALDTNFEHFKTNCIISVGNTFTRRENCNQSWWKEGLDKHTISMELRTPIGG